MLRDIFISLPYFFPSFHSHSTTKKEKSLKYDRNAPLRRPRSLDSTEAVLQIGGFFFNVPGGIFDFCSTKPIYLSVRQTLSLEGTVSLPDLPPKTRFCELNKKNYPRYRCVFRNLGTCTDYGMSDLSTVELVSLSHTIMIKIWCIVRESISALL